MRSSLLRRTVLAAALAGLLPAGPHAATRKLEIEWIDTLGGAATLIVTPAGETILVDTGWPGFESRDAKRIKAALDRRGLTAIDHLVISHYHTDHYGGVPQLAALVPIKHFYDHGPMSELPEDKGFPQMYAAYRAAAKNTTTTLTPGATIALKQAGGPKLSLTVVAAAGEVIGTKDTGQNPACAAATPQPVDTRPPDTTTSLARSRSSTNRRSRRRPPPPRARPARTSSSAPSTTAACARACASCVRAGAASEECLDGRRRNHVS